MKSVISSALSPNTEFDDYWLAFRTLFTPWAWGKGSSVGKVEAWARQYLGTTCAVSFNSGRSALLALLKAFDIGRGDEVIVQAFTCVAVPNSIRWVGATPVFADIDVTYNLDPAGLEKKISKKTKAIIVQHTFGVPAAMDAIVPIVKKHNLLLIEDCAHALGATYLPAGKVGKGAKVGTQGDAAFFSFGRDKVISSVFGGLATIRADHQAQIAAIKTYHKKLNTPSFGWIFQQLFHPVAFSFILPWYRLGAGKALLVVFQRLKFLSFPVYPEEKRGSQPKDFPAKYPNALACLLLKQIKKLERFTRERREISRIYGRGDFAYVRFPVLVDNPAVVIAKAKKRGVLLGNWYHNVIDPTGVDFETVGYKKGSCPRAEEAAKHIINLPTRISLRDAKRVMSVI